MLLDWAPIFIRSSFASRIPCYEWLTLRAALGVGYKRYPDLAKSTNQEAAMSNVFYRLGANFDVELQVQRRWSSDRLMRFAEL